MELRFLSDIHSGITRMGSDFQCRRNSHSQLCNVADCLLTGLIFYNTAEQIIVIRLTAFDFKIRSQSTREFRPIQAHPVNAVVSA